MTFTPTDSIDYVPTTVTVAITVGQGTTTYDAGTVAFVANGTTLGTATYGKGSTPAAIAAALAAAVNGYKSTPVMLIAVDNDLWVTAVTPGTAGDSISYTVENTAYSSSAFSGPSFPSAPISGNLEGGAASGTDAGKLVYSYNDSYDHAGNMTATSNDPVMGSWTFTPDTLNRLVGATNAPVGSTTTNYYCWSYDGFGNRGLQVLSSAAFASGAPACTPQSSASYEGVWAHFQAGTNQFSGTQQAMGGVSYDGAGNILNDGVNQYLYDGDGRICAVSSGGTGEPVLTGYIYNAEGARVAKGSITEWSCDPTVNGFKPLSDYVVGRSGEQVTEMGMDPSGSMAWQHTNVFALGQVIATYDNDGLHFYLNDPLGTRRAQTDYAGVLEQTCLSLPFGDALNCTNSTQFPTEHHFTGKERDTESGNDYFGARYYASSMGRFMSPDWSKSPQAVPYADLENPQSLNLYAYVNNNPLSRVDADGHCGDGWHWLCSVGQAIGNAFTGHCFFCTDTQLNNRTEARRQWLEQHTMVIHPDGSTVDWQTADRKTIDHWFSKSQDPSLSIPNLPIPPGLKGFSDFGKTMGWGTGDAEARARMETLTKEELEKNGVTKEMAEKWRDFYKDEIARNPNNPSAAGGADLMQHAADLLDGK